MILDFVDGPEVHALLDWPYLIESFRQAHAGSAPLIGRAALESPQPDRQSDFLLCLPAWIPGEALGCKLVTSFPGNQAERQLPTVHSLYAVFDPASGVPRAVIDGEALIFRKTAADSALAADLLAPPDAGHLLLIGAGSLAPYLVEAMRCVRPGLSALKVWNRSAPKAEALAERCRADDFAAEALEVRDGALDEALDEALGWADIVVAATMAQSPLVKGARLREGAHANLVGAFTPAMREGDDDLLRRAAIYVDHEAIVPRNGEFTGPIERGVITAEAVRGNLFDLVQRGPSHRPGRVTLFKNGGAAHLDLFTARALLARRSGGA